MGLGMRKPRKSRGMGEDLVPLYCLRWDHARNRASGPRLMKSFQLEVLARVTPVERVGNLFNIFQTTGKIKIYNDKGFGALGEEALLKAGSVVLNPSTERTA